MTTQRVTTEAAILEQYRISLNNVLHHEGLAKVMDDFGYDRAAIEAGLTLLSTSREAWQKNINEDDETSAAYEKFDTLREQLREVYTLHRKKAKVVFRKDMVTAARLDITGTLPKAYIPWMESIRKFYDVILHDEGIATALERLRIKDTDVKQATTLWDEVSEARTLYFRERGESQHATMEKDHALEAIHEWMKEFYAVARIALEDTPQLLEVLGKTVRN